MLARSVTSTRTGLLVVTLATVLGMLAPLGRQPAVADTGAAATTPAPAAASAGGFLYYKLPPVLCTGAGLNVSDSRAFSRDDCGFSTFAVSGAGDSPTVKARFTGPDGQTFDTQDATFRTSDGQWEFEIVPANDWPAGTISVDVLVDGKVAGNTDFALNRLGADVTVSGTHEPGEDLPVAGTVYERDTNATGSPTQTGVAADYSLLVTDADGAVLRKLGPFTAANDGTFSRTIPGTVTAGVSAGPDTGYRSSVAVTVVDATYTDTANGDWAATRAGSGTAALRVPPSTPLVENSFVSSVGWVKPGDTYPFRVFVRNYTDQPASGVTVTIPPVDGTTFTKATALSSSGSAAISSGTITWTVGSLPAAGGDGQPAVATLVVEAKADSTSQDPQIVWKDLSSTATLAYDGKPSGVTLASTSHGPKVIPPGKQYDTARYGDRPFPVVPVDYIDRKHQANHSGDELATIINSPDFTGSTFNLYQEMSFGLLYPHATVPSAGIAQAGWDVSFKSKRYKDNGFVFSDLSPNGTCTGTTLKDAKDTPLYPDRIVDGFYQLPGTTGYYGQDATGSALVGAEAGVGPLMQIDNGCGPTAKAVYDAAMIADPEIDYSDYDTDKDGVVDFFMMIFVGCGGNGVSQEGAAACPYDSAPYDNIWPHSSSLEFSYTDPDTGLKGYVSDDQLKNLEGQPMFYTDDSRNEMTTTDTGIPVYVRVGPYNVNPETVFDSASVISHEYGHSLGLPDFYSLGSRETYGSWMLMASDHSQNMDIFGKQELGWIVPRVLKSGSTTVTNWPDSKKDIHSIDWVQPDGTPYTLQGPNVHNGLAYTAKLPKRQIIDPQKVKDSASSDHVWWSGSGNDFGCPPNGGHNLDIYLPELADVPSGTNVTVSFKTHFDIEWDYDYGFVMYSTDGGTSYTSMPSQSGYTTTTNPNANGCQQQYSNGITGTNASYDAGTATADRLLGSYPDGPFTEDSYDLSAAAGKKTVLRLSYATDAGLAHPGWFIDDLKVTAGNKTIYQTDFEDSGSPDDARVFPGGCKESSAVADVCTDAWKYVSATAGSPADHGYYLEMRDRSGFDENGHGQSERGGPTFSPGLYLMYTDEAHGYGNVGTDDPPAQSPLDSQPEPGSDTPNLDDAAFTAASGDNHFSDKNWTDNYTDPSTSDGNWHFTYGCLSFTVDSMSGTDVGPSTAPGNLKGNVTFDMGAGCGSFDYGYLDASGNPTTPGGGTGSTGGTGGTGGSTGGSGGGSGGSTTDSSKQASGEPVASDQVERAAGASRVETSVALSKRAFANADAAVLALAYKFPDALSAAGLAAQLDGPVLLNPSDHLHPTVASELDRLGVSTVYIAGGTASISEDVANEIRDRGINVVRLAGPSRFETAGAIADQVVKAGSGKKVGQMIVALGAHPDPSRDAWPDALAAGSLSTHGRAPILLSYPDRVPDATMAAVKRDLVAGGRVWIAGGTKAVSSNVEQQLRDAGYDVKRLAGANRYQTALAILEQAVAQGASRSPVVLASGLTFPDALAAAPLAYELGGVLALIDPSTVDNSPSVRDMLSSHRNAIDGAILAGGTAAISGHVADQVHALIADQ